MSGVSEEKLKQSISKACKALLLRQNSDGSWVGTYRFHPQQITMPITYGFVALLDYLELNTATKMKAISYLKENRYSPEISLKVLSDKNLIDRSSAAIIPLIQLMKNKASIDFPSPHRKASHIFEKLLSEFMTLSSTEEDIPKINYWGQQFIYPFILILLSRLGRMNAFDKCKLFLHHPKLIKYFFKMKRFIKNRQILIEKLQNILLQTQNEDGTFYGLPFPATIWCTFALTESGVSKNDPRIIKAINSLEKYQAESGEIVFFRLPIWDTSWSLVALDYAGIDRNTPIINSAINYLINSRGFSDSRYLEKITVLKKLGFCTECWGFSLETKYFGDLDDTAMVIAALSKFSLTYALNAAKECLLPTQNPDGGWPTYIKGLTTNEEWIKWNSYDEFLRAWPYSYISDPSLPEITAHVLFALGRVGFTEADLPVKKAIQYLEKTQRNDGSWIGVWGWLFIYGTSQVLMGLKEAGANMKSPFVRRAVQWLKERQNSDGGWGEDDAALLDPKNIGGRGKSTPVHTAWALMGLISSGELDSEIVFDGISYLLSTQKEDGSWPEERTLQLLFGTRYSNDLHGIYLPLIALSMFTHAYWGGFK
jgi:squalene-hopene/tetraprenyl-beta-curcumene cyclase